MTTPRNTGDEPRGTGVSPGCAASGLGAAVAALAHDCAGRDVPLGEIEDRLEGRSLLLLVFLLAAPFCQPVPLTGLATVFGVPLAYLGWRVMLGKDLRLPPRLRRVVVPKKVFPVVLSGTGRAISWAERRLLRHRGAALAPAPMPTPPWLWRTCGANIFVGSLLLAFPALLPCSNFFPALPVAFTAAALLEQNRRLFVAALAATAVNAAYWVLWASLLWIYGGRAVGVVEEWLRGLLP
jgi:hypothetical protein